MKAPLDLAHSGRRPNLDAILGAFRGEHHLQPYRVVAQNQRPNQTQRCDLVRTDLTAGSQSQLQKPGAWHQNRPKHLMVGQPRESSSIDTAGDDRAPIASHRRGRSQPRMRQLVKPKSIKIGLGALTHPVPNTLESVGGKQFNIPDARRQIIPRHLYPTDVQRPGGSQQLPAGAIASHQSSSLNPVHLSNGIRQRHRQHWMGTDFYESSVAAGEKRVDYPAKLDPLA